MRRRGGGEGGGGKTKTEFSERNNKYNNYVKLNGLCLCFIFLVEPCARRATFVGVCNVYVVHYYHFHCARARWNNCQHASSEEN